MSYKMIGKPQVVKVTHALAERFATMERAPGDRIMRDWRVKWLANQITGGKFRTCEWVCVNCKATGKTYRVNGQHTSNALNGMNGEMPKDLYVTVVEFDCDTLDDVAQLYATFDHRRGVRHTGDINKAFGATREDLDGISAKTLNLAVTAVSIATWGQSYHSKDAEIRAQNALHENPEFVIWLHKTIGPKCRGKNDHVFRGAVAAAMYQTWSKCKKDATEFWKLVKDGAGERPTTADRILNKFLLSHGVASQRSNSSTATACDQRGMQARCISAWNAWRAGETTSLRYFPNAKMPAAK